MKKKEKFQKNILKAVGSIGAAVILVIGAYFFLRGKEEEQTIQPEEELTRASFTDIFSGTSWIDEGSTTLFMSSVVGGVTFMPNIVWEEKDTRFEETKGDVLEKKEKEAIESFLKEESSLTDEKGGLRFQPAIFQGESGWYVVRKEKTPLFMKILGGKEGNVEGAIDFSPLLFSKHTQTIRVQKTQANNEFLIETETRAGEKNIFFFQDNGFEKQGKKIIISKNLNTFPAETRKATIEEFAYKGEGGSIALFLSNNGVKWIKGEEGKEALFKEKGEKLFWRAEIEPDKDLQTSPFIERVRVSYLLHFPEGFEVYKEKARNEANLEVRLP